MEKIYIAKLGKTVGLQGQIKIHIDSDFPEQFKSNTILTTHKNIELTIETINIKNKTVKFKDINTIEDARRYVNSELFTTLEDTHKNCNLNKNQYFWFDMQDCLIFEDEEELGIVKEIHRYPIDDYLEIQTNTTLLSDDFKVKTFLIPYNDIYIISVDTEKKQIITKNAKDILINS